MNGINFELLENVKRVQSYGNCGQGPKEYGVWNKEQGSGTKNMEQWKIFKDQGSLVHRSLSLVCDP